MFSVWYKVINYSSPKTKCSGGLRTKKVAVSKVFQTSYNDQLHRMGT